MLPDDAHPFDLHCWYTSWWEAFGTTNELMVCTVRRAGRLAAVFPLWVEGRLLKSFVNGHSPMSRPLATDREAMDELAQAVMSQAGRRRLELLGLPGEDPSIERLETAAQAASKMSLVEPAYASPFVDTRGDLDMWREKNKRSWKSVEPRRRKMNREYEARFVLVEPPTALEAELDDGLRIEASGWKGREGTAIESAPETATFYRSVARAFHRRDELRLSRVVLDDIAVSFAFCLLYRRRLYLLKSGYDESYRRLAPGLVLRLGMIERCFELGIDALDLLGDEVGWKTRFATGNRPHVNFRTYPSSPIGYLRHRYRAQLRPGLKRVYRRWRPVHR